MTEILKLFLKLGSVGFGGPIALIGYMEEECVKRRKWLSIQEFHRFVAVAKLFPGPLATLIAIRIGRLRHPRWGGWLAGFGLIMPAFLMILGLAQVTSLMERLEIVRPFWIGLTLAALAVAFNAAVNFSKPIFKSREFNPFSRWSVLTISGVLTFLYPQYEIIIIIFFGCLGLSSGRLKKNRIREAGSTFLLLIIFWGCVRASIFTFGSGIAIVPVLQTHFIDHYHFVSNHQFLQGLTLGQITPGPLVIVSTYLGWITAGIAGATVATLGTFLPTFFFGIFVMPRVENFILQSERLKTFFEWLVASVCGAIFGSLIRLMLLSVRPDDIWMWQRFILVIILFFAMIRFKLTPGIVFILGGFLAYLL